MLKLTMQRTYSAADETVGAADNLEEDDDSCQSNTAETMRECVCVCVCVCINGCQHLTSANKPTLPMFVSEVKHSD